MFSSTAYSRAARLVVIAAVAAVALGVLSPPAFGQYFGRNKVQYEKFDYKILKTEHFDIYFYPEEEEAVKVAAQLAERWYARLSRIFGHNLRGRQPLVMYASHPQFEQTTVLSELISEGTGGVTESLKRRIIVPFGASLDDTDHVIGHELVHAFQYDMSSGAGPVPGQGASGGGIERAPLWLIEGAAEYFSIGPVDPHTTMWMRDLLNQKKMPTIKDLQNYYKYFPYRFGQAVLAYIGGRWGDLVVAKLMKDVVRGLDYERAIQKNLGITSKQLSADWHEAMKRDFASIQAATTKPDASGRLLLKGSEEDPYNVAPAVSPDGRKFVFISSRDLFSLEMFMGDTQTGKVTKRITKQAIDPHFQSIQFIYSVGSWNAQGDRFVFGAVEAGKPVLAFLDGEGRRSGEDIRFPELGEILNPTWSPDGKRIAFSALTGGYSDVYIYDLEAKTLKNMTSDPFGDLQPAWSPDGRWIAFVTERFSTQLRLLSTGNMRIGLMNPDTGEIRELAGFKTGKHIAPQWSADASSLFFVGDLDGISNVYRYDFASNKTFQITNLYTGVSGITSLSPTLSIAAKTNELLYSVYDQGNFSIYSLDPKAAEAGTPVDLTAVANTAAVLPPKDRPGSDLMGLIKNTAYGLPDASTFSIEPYKAKLSLDYAAPPQIGVGMDRYGTYAGGGVAFYFSDMLGMHNLMTMVQIYNRLVDSAALVGYQNSRNRLNFGFVAQRMPYLYGGYNIYYDTIAGEPAIVEQEIIYRQIYYQVGGFASYPLNPAQRFELAGGYSYIDFDNVVYTRAYSYYDGMPLLDDETDLPSPPGIHMPFASAALIYDTSLFGATAPVIGQSYRFEISPTFGTLNFTGFLADYRKYIVPVRPFTVAFRAMHYGRYGKGADDPRLYPMFIGYNTMIRGYTWESFDAVETDPSSPNSFDFERLFGSKMFILNLELRFPLFGALGVGKGYYGVFPVDFIAFYDMGVAWGQDSYGVGHKPAFLFNGDRKFLRSYGAGLRLNLFGALVAGVNYVKPLDRPGKGWHWEFSFWPGF
jgi:Tol biopolymer transport system component